MAGSTVLLNSSIFAIPNYILSAMNLPLSILDNISKLAHSFLWGNNGSKRGLHTIGWVAITL